MKIYGTAVYNHVFKLQTLPNKGDYLHLPWIAGCSTKPCTDMSHSGYVVGSPDPKTFTLRVTVQIPGPGSKPSYREDDWSEGAGDLHSPSEA